ncbi:hypothetical protein [Gramella sp. AN32]|uniref:Tetratricopeptide repeat protein n=1 Tax=Christiangramia antarctica TaxID=2058158 RepID=A0ABW5X3Q6_9FLAO|nr:hypothetical protein [Gramella sp. AN32]MCM4155681.1 hypothetical protein [Gramella sp. AN32]
MKKILLLTTIMSVFITFGQGNTIFYNFETLSAEIEDAKQENDIERIFTALNKVNKNDSIYAVSLVTKSYYLLNSDRNQEALETLEEGLSLEDWEQQISFLVNKGVVLKKMEKYKEALEFYDSALKNYPVNASLLLGKAAILESMDKPEETYETIKKALIYNPFSTDAHIKLGKLAYDQNNTTLATMCFDMALLINPDGTNSFRILKHLDELLRANNKNEGTTGFSILSNKNQLAEVNLIMNNRLALDDRYKTEAGIDLPVVKQNHIMLENMKSVKLNEDFINKTYLPFFNWIRESDNFEPFIYTVIYAVENEKYKKKVEKEVDEITEFIQTALAKWKELSINASTKFLEVDGMQTSFNEYALEGTGMKKDDHYVGKWDIYNVSGRKSGIAEFNDAGEKSGEWKWYYPNGQLKEISHFAKGELNGENQHYYENGKLKSHSEFENGNLIGEFKYYNNDGALVQKKYFENNALNGEFSTYFSFGEMQPEVTGNYVDGVLQGKAFEYYANGDVYLEMNFKDDLKEGKETGFLRNGKKFYEQIYKEGVSVGRYHQYSLSENIVLEGEFNEEGGKTGEWKTYFPNGILESLTTYKDGEINGLYQEYDADGKLFYEYDYRKEEIIGYRFYEKNGDLIKEGKKKSGEFFYESFTPYGQKKSEGLYDISGGKTGEWKFYDEYGKLDNSGAYKENEAQGVHKTFNSYGALISEINYKNNLEEGSYKTYHPNGKIYSEGFFMAGKRHGEFQDYYIDGTIKTRKYYHKGDLNGEVENYGPEGKIYSKDYYDFGDINKSVYFDLEEKAFDSIQYNNENAKYTITSKHANGSTKSVTDFVHGIKMGVYKYYDLEGELRTTGEFLNNERTGIWKWYDRKGNLSSEVTYDAGEIAGLDLDYYENGQIEDEDSYNYGVPQGTWKSYYPNGILRVETIKENGETHGTKKFYAASGELQYIRFYNYGRLIGYGHLDEEGNEVDMIPLDNETGHVISYYKNGNISREYHLMYGKFDGDYKTYFPNGELEEITRYKDGWLHGTHTKYFSNGNKDFETEYYFDERMGASKTYYENGNLKKDQLYKSGDLSGESKYYSENGELETTIVYFNGESFILR